MLGYGELGDGRRPAFYRQGGVERLAERMAAGEIEPLAGLPDLHRRPRRRSPACAARWSRSTSIWSRVTCRCPPLAAAIRERTAALPGVQAIGLVLRSNGRAQVSTNLIDIEGDAAAGSGRTHQQEAAAHAAFGAAGSELVGLMPARVAARAAGEVLRLPGMEADRMLEVTVSGEFE